MGIQLVNKGWQRRKRIRMSRLRSKRPFAKTIGRFKFQAASLEMAVLHNNNGDEWRVPSAIPCHSQWDSSSTPRSFVTRPRGYLYDEDTGLKYPTHTHTPRTEEFWKKQSVGANGMNTLEFGKGPKTDDGDETIVRSWVLKAPNRFAGRTSSGRMEMNHVTFVLVETLVLTRTKDIIFGLWRTIHP